MVKITKLKTHQYGFNYCVRAYGAKNSDHHIKNSPIPTESQFAKFNARQISRYTAVYAMLACSIGYSIVVPLDIVY